MRKLFFIATLFLSYEIQAQELYASTEPASTLPARSMALKYSGKFVKTHTGRFETRHMPEVKVGLTKNLMVYGGASFSDMFSSNMRWESAQMYAQYRFFSQDEMQKHIRMALFAKGAYSRNKRVYEDINLSGDVAGLEAGIILTQLWHKLALSSTLGYANAFNNNTIINNMVTPSQAFNYSLSGGYLVLPKKYTSYKQTNLNVYAEFLGQQTIDRNRYFIDFAPAIQFIFHSHTKLNLGYRFELGGNMERMSNNLWLIGVDRTFLNVIKRKPKVVH